MASIKSVFGAYADKLQLMIDKRLDAFETPWFTRYFDFDTPQTSLNYVSVIGRSRIEAAATVTTRGSRSPLRSRATMEKLTGAIPPIQVKYQMLEEDLRNYLMLQSLPVSDEVKKKAALDLLFDDVKKVGDAAMKRIDAFVLEAISTGQITLTTTNNPDGQVAPTAIDLLMPSFNKTNGAVVWSTAASATPITDIAKVVNDHAAKGNTFEKVLMSWTAWQYFIATTQVKDLYGAFLGKSNNKVIPTLEVVNDFLRGQQLPVIELVNKPIGIEKDGVISTIYPFATTVAVFIPAGKLGKIKNAVAAEEIKPVEKVSYAKFNNALLSKWQENEPWAEYTKSELNAFPAVEAIDGIHILTVTGF